MPTEIATIPTPTLDMMRVVKDDSQCIGNFIAWLNANRMEICVLPRDGSSRWSPVMVPVERLLARYYEIDLAAAEREKRAILDNLRKASP